MVPSEKSRQKSGKKSGEQSGDEAVVSFETAAERIEQIVAELEGGELDLEASLVAFELGVKLSKQCAEQLESAQQRVEILVRQGGDWVARPFETDADEEDVLEEDG